MTRDTYQQFWYSGVVFMTKLGLFTVSVKPEQKHFWLIEIIRNPCDTAPLTLPAVTRILLACMVSWN